MTAYDIYNDTFMTCLCQSYDARVQVLLITSNTCIPQVSFLHDLVVSVWLNIFECAQVCVRSQALYF